ncbi:hypothetical protein ACFZ8E_06235 [Methylobacterium sp. HMF5984]|uniref:hypothetical protein n=1 Tax=Methylobacterium sp. HMF5984 TaxID=3367370 RepID=UPI003854B488
MTARASCGFKTGVDGTGRRRMTVAAVIAGSQPVVHLRLREGAGERSRSADTIDLSLRQANALVRALNAAIEAAETDPRRDGPSLMPAARAVAGADCDDDGAEA